MSNAYAQIVACAKGQWAENTFGMAGDIYVHVHEEHPISQPSPLDAPNLLLWTGRDHRLLLTIKEDQPCPTP